MRESLFDAYETTIVSVRHPVLGWTDPALVALEERRSAVVLTAWNPGFERPDQAQNEAAGERLRVELVRAGHAPWCADGRAPDGSAHEAGWIVWGMDVAEGIAIAARFGQFAVYAYDEAGVRRTVPCGG